MLWDIACIEGIKKERIEITARCKELDVAYLVQSSVAVLPIEDEKRLVFVDELLDQKKSAVGFS